MKNIKTISILFLLFSSMLILIPTVKAVDVNIGTIPTYWGGYSFYNTTEVYYGGTGYTGQITHVDNNVLHDGHTSIRIDAPANVNNSARELNWGGYGNNWSIPVSGGDTFYFSCWIKTGSSTANQNGNTSRGGIIGVDLYHDTNRVWEYAHGTTTNFTYQQFQYYSSYQWIPYGSDWTLMIINFTIPTIEFITDDYGNPFDPSVTINYVIPWITASWQDNNELASVWFSDAEIYINPTEAHNEQQQINLPNSDFSNNAYWNVSAFNGVSGHWIIKNTNQTLANKINYDMYNFSIANFKGYVANFSYEIGALLPSWWWSCHGDFDLGIDITGSSAIPTKIINVFQSKTTIDATTGFVSGQREDFQYYVNNFGYSGTTPFSDKSNLKIWFTKINDTCLEISYPNYGIDLSKLWNNSQGYMINNAFTGIGSIKNVMWDNKYVNYSIPVNSDFWNNVSISMFVGWSGFPDYDIYYDGKLFGYSAQFQNQSLTTSDTIPVKDSLPSGSIIPQTKNWLTDLWGLATSLFNIVFNFLDLALKVLYIIVPYLPWIGLIYLIDAGIESFKQRSFAPVGLLFLSLWSMFSTIVLWGIYIIQTIVNLLPF